MSAATAVVQDMDATSPAVENSGAALEHAFRERVDVWLVALEPGGGEAALPAFSDEVALDPRGTAAAFLLLSDSEREFAARLRVGAEAWVAARVALRSVLGRYLGLAPGRVSLESGANGKPRLAPGASADLRFNLSHSGDVALIAVRLGREVGVDLEKVRPGVDGAAILRDCFTAPERLGLSALADDEPGETFFRAWVRREALAKATGRGIVSPPAADDAARFTVRDLDGISGYAAAIASEGADWSVRSPRSPVSA